jgi:hypothetical protein
VLLVLHRADEQTLCRLGGNDRWPALASLECRRSRIESQTTLLFFRAMAGDAAADQKGVDLGGKVLVGVVTIGQRAQAP